VIYSWLTAYELLKHLALLCLVLRHTVPVSLWLTGKEVAEEVGHQLSQCHFSEAMQTETVLG